MEEGLKGVCEAELGFAKFEMGEWEWALDIYVNV